MSPMYQGKGSGVQSIKYIFMVGCYFDSYFVGLWGHENPRDTICAKIRTGFVVTFSNFHLL